MPRIVNFILCPVHFFFSYPELFTQFPETPKQFSWEVKSRKQHFANKQEVIFYLNRGRVVALRRNGFVRMHDTRNSFRPCTGRGRRSATTLPSKLSTRSAPADLAGQFTNRGVVFVSGNA